MTRILFVHGWAYGPEMWQSLTGGLAGTEHRFIDLGFFNAPQTHEGEFDCVITHSYGLMWLLQQPQIRAHKIVSISGIATYVRSETNSISRAQIRAMCQQLNTQPEELLGTFYDACGDDTPPPVSSPDQSRLGAALKDMEKLDLRPALADKQIMALASQGDKIVPAKLSGDMFDKKKIIWHSSASHILPKTDPAWCMSHIQEYLNA